MSSKDAKDVKADAGNALYHFAFTWNKPKDMTDVQFMSVGLTRLMTALKSFGRFIFQLERGLESQLLHYQGYVNLKAKKRLGQLAKILHAHELTGLHLSPSHDHEALKSYCMKKDLTYVDGPWDDRDYEGMGVSVLDEKHLYPWQAEVLKQLRAEPDDRKVCWLVDQKGCAGKTQLAKFLLKHKLALPLQYTDSKDAMYMVTSLPWQPAYVFDLTRVKPAALSATDLYAVMEQIKNGLLQNTKYVSKAGILRKPSHVWVFCNHVPDYKSLSQDRWMVYEINENKTLVGFDKKKFQYESKKRGLLAEIKAGREAKRRRVEASLVAELVEADPADDEKAVEEHLTTEFGELEINPNAEA